MRVWIMSAALSAVCLLSSCATPYQPQGFTGGYSEERSNNIAQVSFRGNRFNSPDTLHAYLLRRCAEVSQQNGYDYFALVNSEAPNDGAKVDKYTASTTIKMFKGGDKADAGVRAYDAAAVIRAVPLDPGETPEASPPPPEVVSVAGRMPVLNPNLPTNERPRYEF